MCDGRSVQPRCQRLELRDAAREALAVVGLRFEPEILPEVLERRARAFELRVELAAIAILLGGAGHELDDAARLGERPQLVALSQMNGAQVPQHAREDLARPRGREQ